MFKRNGFTLVELVIVLALSLAMIGLVSGVYSQRRTLANDDAAKQITSSIQTIAVQAQQGLGPTTTDGTSKFSTGDVIYGEAVEFRSHCSPDITGNPCMRVYKLKKSKAGVVSSYESYDITSPQNFTYTSFPFTDNNILVVKNISGDMYYSNNYSSFINNGSIGSSSPYTFKVSNASSPNYSITVSPNIFLSKKL
ncbi:MAG: type II secretion system protein [Candidatus Saccharibacteria bacterium]